MIKRNITMLVIAVLLISLVACSSSMDPTNSLSTQTSVPITEPRTVEKTESVPTPTLSPLPTISPVPTAAPTIEPTDEPVPESVNPEEYIPEEQNEDFASQDVAQVPSQDSVPEPTRIQE